MEHYPSGPVFSVPNTYTFVARALEPLLERVSDVTLQLRPPETTSGRGIVEFYLHIDDGRLKELYADAKKRLDVFADSDTVPPLDARIRHPSQMHGIPTSLSYLLTHIPASTTAPAPTVVARSPPRIVPNADILTRLSTMSNAAD